MIECRKLQANKRTESIHPHCLRDFCPPLARIPTSEHVDAVDFNIRKVVADAYNYPAHVRRIAKWERRPLVGPLRKNPGGGDAGGLGGDD
jgi:hypothetical protein